MRCGEGKGGAGWGQAAGREEQSGSTMGARSRHQGRRLPPSRPWCDMPCSQFLLSSLPPDVAVPGRCREPPLLPLRWRRYTWLAAKREPWTAELHSQWPPKFQQAVRELLLIYHAGRLAAPSAAEAVAAATEAFSIVKAEVAKYDSGGRGGGGQQTRGAKRARLQELEKRVAATAAAVAVLAASLAPQLAAAASKGGKGGKGRKGRGLLGSVKEHAPLSVQRLPEERLPGSARPAVHALPPELLLRIIQELAYPISAWI